MAHTLACRNLSFLFSERGAAYGRHSFWVAETYVLHSQNEGRSLWSIFILGCGNLGFPFPERRAKPMVHIHFELRIVCSMFPERNAKPMVGHSFWVAEG